VVSWPEDPVRVLVAWTVEVVSEAAADVVAAETGQIVVYRSTITVVSSPEAPVRVLVAWTVEVVSEVLTAAEVEVADTGQMVV
jgi:hypothetical protein